MSKLDIRLARPDDRLTLIELQRRASLASETGDVRQQLLDDPDIIDLDEEMLANNEVIVAEIGDRIVGFATIIAHEGEDAELEGLFVEPSEWRKGIAKQLVHAIVREAGAWGANRLHVMANQNVLGFYQATGFTKIGERKTQLGPVGFLMEARKASIAAELDVGRAHSHAGLPVKTMASATGERSSPSRGPPPCS